LCLPKAQVRFAKLAPSKGKIQYVQNLHILPLTAQRHCALCETLVLFVVKKKYMFIRRIRKRVNCFHFGNSSIRKEPSNWKINVKSRPKFTIRSKILTFVPEIKKEE
jgi:hypothetical protein